MDIEVCDVYGYREVRIFEMGKSVTTGVLGVDERMDLAEKFRVAAGELVESIYRETTEKEVDK